MLNREVGHSFKSPSPKAIHGKPYWDGMRDGKIVIQKCADCGAFTHPPGPRCTSCLSPNREYVALSGLGTVYTYTVTHRAMHEEFKPDLPYVICYVRLDEGLTIVSWLRDVAPQDVRIGMRVQAMFEKIDDETTLHRFRPVPA
ncbi:MAG TPA: Zn-ribbon domain-containing OB-fold protein [Ramlibacter sp.]|nr:Zn-ribbon domain-containing OB-fold protein [Ramlibacter sp.]